MGLVIITLGKIIQTHKNKYYIPYGVKAEAELFGKMKEREQGTKGVMEDE